MTEHERTIYRGKIVDLCLDTVELPNGRRFELEIVRHPGGEAAVALDPAGRVCLLHQYRHVAGGWLWELPAGKIDHQEPPLQTAQRELAEEAGLHAVHWRSLGWIISSPGIFTERVHLFLATGLTLVASAAEEHEVFEVHWRPLESALAQAASGEISDAKTVAGLFRAQWALGGDARAP